MGTRTAKPQAARLLNILDQVFRFVPVLAGDGRLDAIVLTVKGKLVVAANPGAAGKPWRGLPRALWSDGATALGAAISHEWGDNGKLHVMVARPDGIFRYAVNGKDAPPADFRRLTGIALDSYKPMGRRCQDLLVLTGDGTLYEMDSTRR